MQSYKLYLDFFQNQKLISIKIHLNYKYYREILYFRIQKHSKMKRLYYVIIFIFLFSVVDTYARIPLKFTNNNSALIGISIRDMSGKTIVDYNSSKLMTPASIAKCITSAACMIGLPSDFRFDTDVIISGSIFNGILYGNVIISGSGDPTLESSYFPEYSGFISETIHTLNQLGIDSIAGRFIPKQNDYPEFGYSPYWMLEDIGWDYGAGLYGINYKDNTIKVTFQDPFSNIYTCIPQVDVSINNYLTIGDKNINIYPSNDWCINIIGTTIAHKKPLIVNCSNPTPFVSIYKELKQYIPFGNKNIEDTVFSKIYSKKSPTRDEILRSMMVRSDNLFAQGMLRALLLDSVGEKTDSRAIKTLTSLLKSFEINCDSQKIVDGCGLARNAKISPRFMSELLLAMAKSRYAEKYIALFPVAGKDGTVKRLFNNTRLDGCLALKSGSMSGVLCYSGYKLDNSGMPTHIVTIMVNNFSCKTYEIRKAIECYLLKIFQ